MKNSSKEPVFKNIEQGLLLVEKMRRKVDELQGELQERKAIIDAQASDLEHLERMLSQKNNELRQAVENYQNSFSWRLTKPMRMIHKKFLGLVRSGKDEDKTILKEQEQRTIPEVPKEPSSGEVQPFSETVTLSESSGGEVFDQPWYRFFRREILVEKLHNRLFYASRPLTIGIAITEDNETTPAGDYYTAKGLGKELTRVGFVIRYLPQIPDEKWYDIPEEIDVLIVLIDHFDLRKIPHKEPMLKIAWIRNWVERWTEHPWFKDYDVILTTSEEARRIIKKNTGKESELLMIGADTDIFRPVPPQERYACDIVFSGSYWHSPREIMESLNIRPEWTCCIYGKNWGDVDSLKKYWKGFINYRELPCIYSSSKIVLDDHNHVTKPYGLINSRVFEAMACGCCVVTNAVRDIDKVFPEGAVAVYHDSEELTRILTELLSDNNRRKEMGRLARETILSDHTYKKRADLFKRILLQAAEDGSFY